MSEFKKYNTIEHLKSGISISTHTGCTLGCPYCLLHAGEAEPKVTATGTPEQLVSALLAKDSLFLDGMTPIFINNRSDPFLPEVRNSTIHLLSLLAEAKTRSPIVLVSKLLPNTPLFGLCKSLRILFFYSYSNIPEDANYRMLQSLEQFDGLVPQESRFHYFRPVIHGKNDDPAAMGNVIRMFSSAGFRASVISGIRITRENARFVGTAMKAETGAHKILDDTLFLQLQRLPGLRQDYMLFRHTSCAIDSFLHRRNRLGYYGRMSHCSAACPNQTNCASDVCFSSRAYTEIAERFPDMQFLTNDGGINITSPVSQEITAFLKNAYGMHVQAEHEVLSPSEEVFQK